MGQTQTTYDTLLRDITWDYLNNVDLDNPPSADNIKENLLNLTNKAIDEYNLGERDPSAPVGAKSKEAYPNQKPFGERIQKRKALESYQIACIILHLYGACRIVTEGESADPDYDILALYQKDGANNGVYATSDSDFRRTARMFNHRLTSHDFEEIMFILKDLSPRKPICSDPDLIAVNNGVYNYKEKILYNFSPDLVFLSKSHVNFINNAPNPVIHNDDDDTDWDVVSWIEELSDDPDVVNLLWEILGAIIRPNVSWNKSAWLYSEEGNNGKGTLCTLMRNLCGPGSFASIKLKDFGQDFLLEPLIRSSAIIVDENDVGTYIDQAANLKAVITNDVISINRKYKSPVAIRFHGFMVQCMNEFPKVKDRSDSFYRRQLFIPMEKHFKGRERKYIKNDYLYRKEVLEYVLFHVLAETDYYELSEPAVCQAVLEEYKEYNDPIRQFFYDVEENATWDLLPYKFLYDLYLCWHKKNVPSGSAVGRNIFMREIRRLTKSSNTFYIAPSDCVHRADGKITKPEPMILEYGVEAWQNRHYKGASADRICLPDINGKAYRGLLRYGVDADDDTT